MTDAKNKGACGAPLWPVLLFSTALPEKDIRALAEWRAAIVKAEREACAKTACDFLTKGRSPLGRQVFDAIMERSNDSNKGPAL